MSRHLFSLCFSLCYLLPYFQLEVIQEVLPINHKETRLLTGHTFAVQSRCNHGPKSSNADVAEKSAEGEMAAWKS